MIIQGKTQMDVRDVVPTIEALHLLATSGKKIEVPITWLHAESMPSFGTAVVDGQIVAISLDDEVVRALAQYLNIGLPIIRGEKMCTFCSWCVDPKRPTPSEHRGADPNEHTGPRRGG